MNILRLMVTYNKLSKKGGNVLKDYIEERVLEVAKYIIDSKDTIRKTAKVFGVSKSTIHKDMTERLPKINPVIAEQTHSILELNKAERHIRGGKATKMKYKTAE
jgi:putative DeoR family transcriptional regulator, stage III sporulation protein D